MSLSQPNAITESDVESSHVIGHLEGSSTQSSAASMLSLTVCCLLQTTELNLLGQV
jgi:hypothetical protein